MEKVAYRAYFDLTDEGKSFLIEELDRLADLADGDSDEETKVLGDAEWDFDLEGDEDLHERFVSMRCDLYDYMEMC